MQKNRGGLLWNDFCRLLIIQDSFYAHKTFSVLIAEEKANKTAVCKKTNESFNCHCLKMTRRWRIYDQIAAAKAQQFPSITLKQK